MAEDSEKTKKEFLFQTENKDKRYFHMNEMTHKMTHMKKIWMVSKSNFNTIFGFLELKSFHFRFENVNCIIKSIKHVKVSKEDFINYTVS